MNGRYALIEMAFVYSVVLGFAFCELRKTRRDIRDDKRDPPPS